MIVSTNEDINRTLESVGFDDEFNIIEQGPDSVNGPQVTLDRTAELTPEMIREAHQILSSLNEENQKMFRDVLEQFDQEVEQQTR